MFSFVYSGSERRHVLVSGGGGDLPKDSLNVLCALATKCWVFDGGEVRSGARIHVFVVRYPVECFRVVR